MQISHDATLYITGTLAVLGIVASTYLLLENQSKDLEIYKLVQDKGVLLQTKNQLTANLTVASTTINELDEELENVREDLEDLADDYRDEKGRNEDFEDQIRDLAGTLGDLDKLAKIDEELLQKYSKVYFLNENYSPEKVKRIRDKYVLAGKNVQFFHARAIDYLEDMFKAAARDDIDLKVVSAYRSFDQQVDLKGQFTQVYGEGANTFSADQGYSEHQLGTTLDLTVSDIGGAYLTFAETEAYKWLRDNAHKYGFILSYPKDNSFYIFEPWHWRFVGTDLARHLDRSKDDFYSMDQREVDEYLLELFD